jgi:putative salt-induced outer membrane protein
MNPKQEICIWALALLLAPTALLAQNAAAGAAGDVEAPKYGWSGKGQFGLVSTSGNSDTFSLNLGAELTYNSEKWHHLFTATALKSENNGETTAKRYDLGAQSDYKLNQKSYVFGALRYDNDDFSAYEDQATIAAGYGRQILDTEKHKLKLEAGVGYRSSTVAETGESQDGMIFRGLGEWVWQLTASTALGDRFLVEAGSDNTYLQNDLGLTVAINTKFALKLDYQVRNNSDVPVGVDKTDTQTSVNLVYSF